MLRIQGLRREFKESGSTITGGVLGIDLTIEGGEFFTLLGPSGCGKTTTLRSIAGLEKPDAGRITLGERVLFDAAARVDVSMQERQIGMVFQSYAVWPHMTVYENAAYPLRFGQHSKLDKKEVRTRVMDVLEIVDLASFADRPAPKLSGGQQQRLALARALVHCPSVLLLDEPLSNLDAALRDQMRREIRRLQRETKVTAIYVTHDQAEALAISDRIAVMNHGLVEQIGTSRAIYSEPANAFVARFIGLSNMLTCDAVTSASGDEVTVKTAIGELRGLRMAGHDAGKDVIIRPENILLNPPGDAGVINRINGRIASVAFMGELTEYEVDAGQNVTLTVRGRDHTLTPGTEVTLGLPVDAVKVL
ncbi:MAG: ABC transporter ATP-binding protein [Pseudolabrys sp.]|jgi:iron(III) transport system ATP-binding protein